MSKPHKIAYIGEKYICYALSSLGVTVFPKSGNEARDKLSELVDTDEYGIIFLSEGNYDDCYSIIEKVDSKSIPAIIVLPDISGSKNIAMDIMRERMKKAAGRDIAE